MEQVKESEYFQNVLYIFTKKYIWVLEMMHTITLIEATKRLIYPQQQKNREIKLINTVCHGRRKKWTKVQRGERTYSFLLECRQQKQ